MLRVVACLATEHDWRLVVLAGLVCLLTSVATISIFQRSLATGGRISLLWTTVTGVAAGYGIWATHFIAMLAYTPGVKVGYDLLLTLTSLGAATLITGTGFAIGSVRRSPTAALCGGAITGLGIAVMHYTGMSALEVPGYIVWVQDLVIASIILGAALSAAAVYVAVFRHGIMATSLAACLLASAILAHHFIGMGAAEIAPDPTRQIAALSLSPYALSIAVASAAIAMLGIGLIAALAAGARQHLIEVSSAQIAEQAARLEAALTNMSQGLCLFDRDQRVVVANRRYSEMYGLDSEQVRPGTSAREILEARIERGTYGPSAGENFIDGVLDSFAEEANDTIQLADGRFIAVQRRRLEDGGMISTHEDVTKRYLAEARVEHLAHHDIMTGLPNRARLREELETALADLRQDGVPFAVLVLNLDRFKEINDTLGHAAGDALLLAVSQRIRKCVKRGDMVARLSGDEFAIVQKTSNPVEESIALARRTQEVLGADFELRGCNASVGASVGIAIAPQDGDCADELLKNADLALYKAKSDGRGAFHLFEPELDRKMQARRTLEMELRSAISNGGFQLYYQAIVNLELGQICGFEALIRWKHPERGMISPAEFVPLAEETGLIIPLGEWVIRQACGEAGGWPEEFKVAVNVSPIQFRSPNLADVVIQALASAQMTPNRLELEITESVMLEDEEGTLRMLKRLHNLGVRISLDDFGTGYSSLSLLRKFPFDKIKIDRSFVGDLSPTNADAVALVRSVAQLGVSLGMATTAEGVETKEQAEQVGAEGCTEIQGNYISAPRPAAEIRKLIQQNFRIAMNAA
jgi:diguanylate cyclase (GGDEF)-like protein